MEPAHSWNKRNALPAGDGQAYPPLSSTHEVPEDVHDLSRIGGLCYPHFLTQRTLEINGDKNVKGSVMTWGERDRERGKMSSCRSGTSSRVECHQCQGRQHKSTQEPTAMAIRDAWRGMHGDVRSVSTALTPCPPMDVWAIIRRIPVGGVHMVID